MVNPIITSGTLQTILRWVVSFSAYRANVGHTREKKGGVLGKSEASEFTGSNLLGDYVPQRTCETL